jgi:hypothetical protein
VHGAEVPQIAHKVFNCRIRSPRDTTALTNRADIDGMYFTLAVYSRVRRGGALVGCNDDLTAARNAGVQQNINDQTTRFSNQIDETINLVRREMGSDLKSAIIEVYLGDLDRRLVEIL